jgi:hypothetical protein
MRDEGKALVVIGNQRRKRVLSHEASGHWAVLAFVELGWKVHGAA